LIGKVPRGGRGFRGLVNYLLHGDRRRAGTARVAWTATRNLLVDDPDQAPLLMHITARKSVRVTKPVYHFVISWHPQERPTPELMRAIADATCVDLALDDYQRLYIAHHDTLHPHVHVVVNRVHPETGIAWQTSHDYRRIEQSLARQALVMGKEPVPGRHNGLITASAASRRQRDADYQQARRTNPKSPSRGRMSREEIVRLRLALGPVFSSARGWSDLAAALAAHDLALVRKGQGLVLANPHTHAEMKLSDLGRNIRFAELEQRFGPWREDQTRQSPTAARSIRLRRRRELDR